MMRYYYQLFVLFLFAISFCFAENDPLPSWNEGENKKAILEFVQKATDKNSNGYIDAKYRIATIDNDGTMWTEKPTYTQLVYSFQRIHDMAPQHPEWKDQQPFKAILENDMALLSTMPERELAQAIIVTYAGSTISELQKSIEHFFKTAIHPRFKIPYPDAIYQPMVELVHYLQDNGFKTYIVTGGGVQFVRAFAPASYNIPVDQIIGTALQTKPISTSELLILPEFVVPINDKAGKMIDIQRIIGLYPAIAIGNSDGDIEMLNYAEPNKPHLALLVHHDDAEREYAYDTGAEKALEMVKPSGWKLISMKNDFKTIFKDHIAK